MAALTGIIDGTDVVLSIAGTPVSAITSNGLEFTMNTRETTNKDSATSATHLATRYTWSVSVEGYIAYDATYNYQEILAAAKAGTAISVTFGTLETGVNPIWVGNAIITQVSQSNPDGDNVTFSATLLGTGDLTESATGA